MNAVKEKEEIQVTEVNPERRIILMFPEQPGERRKIQHLWDNYYRVNFWRRDPNLVARSYFVWVDEDSKVWTVKDKEHSIGLEKRESENILVEEPVKE
jgi:hypothetical protein